MSQPTTERIHAQNTPSVITQAMRAQSGRRSEPWLVEVERDAIQRYAEAIEDPNPIYRDEAFASTTPHGTIIAPPVFAGFPISEPQSVRVESPYFRHVTGGTELEYTRPIRAGERLVAAAVLRDLYEKEGRAGVGHMLFQIIETIYWDLEGKMVLRQTTTDITFEG